MLSIKKLTFSGCSADSDQAGDDSVYRALIKYIAHLVRKAKRKCLVYYHQWRERRRQESRKTKKQLKTSKLKMSQLKQHNNKHNNNNNSPTMEQDAGRPVRNLFV